MTLCFACMRSRLAAYHEAWARMESQLSWLDESASSLLARAEALKADVERATGRRAAA